MKLTIECECTNKLTMSAPPKKYLQLRDNLETKSFRYDGVEYDKSGKVKKFHIRWDKCFNYILLGVD